jgi:hypothetical protein
LQRAVDEIWARIKWIEKRYEEERKRLIPVIPKDSSFKNRYLRGLLMGAGGLLEALR